ncbi:MAG: DUF938 domain-containing protein [Rhodospirillales bacterium]
MEKGPGIHAEQAGGGGGRLVSESCERNKDPILEVLKRVLPETGLVLEIGAGTGQHPVHFAPAFPGLAWQPTDPDAASRASIAAWAEAAGAPNLLSPVALDVMDDPWPVADAVAVISINMIHIAPWACCLGLIAGAKRVLAEGGVLFLYGPFKVGGRHTAPSNKRFDMSLRSRDPAWGVRNLDDVAMEAREAGFQLAETVQMPANNLSVVFRRQA